MVSDNECEEPSNADTQAMYTRRGHSAAQKKQISLETGRILRLTKTTCQRLGFHVLMHPAPCPPSQPTPRQLNAIKSRV